MPIAWSLKKALTVLLGFHYNIAAILEIDCKWIVQKCMFQFWNHYVKISKRKIIFAPYSTGQFNMISRTVLIWKELFQLRRLFKKHCHIDCCFSYKQIVRGRNETVSMRNYLMIKTKNKTKQQNCPKCGRGSVRRQMFHHHGPLLWQRTLAALNLIFATLDFIQTMNWQRRCPTFVVDVTHVLLVGRT